ncbi:hypothetical protein D9756_002620 [Leucocoprinus leucothites]|uniref:Uncharacterized protein n=1 Tax=Leucocoprinus leucothites TaxID=201217 RepID=A0A8H5LLS1_9AGAR|nr:hypothetical protein D9756_002620 [Leucoagaricus leucothites]
MATHPFRYTSDQPNYTIKLGEGIGSDKGGGSGRKQERVERIHQFLSGIGGGGQGSGTAEAVVGAHELKITELTPCDLDRGHTTLSPPPPAHTQEWPN